MSTPALDDQSTGWRLGKHVAGLICTGGTKVTVVSKLHEITRNWRIEKWEENWKLLSGERQTPRGSWLEPPAVSA